MNSNSPIVRDIKKKQKEHLILREVSQLFSQAAMDDPELQGISIIRVALSPDKGMCTVYFYSPDGKAGFDKCFDRLKLYKPSLRTALAHQIKSRYTPDLMFKYDEQFEKQAKIEALIDKLKDEGKL